MILKIGSSGEDVKKLQEKLGLKSDGAFGPGTEAAVKKWQNDNGLTSDGLVGEGTWTKMFGSKQLITEPSVAKSSGNLKIENLKGHIPDAVIAQIPEVVDKFKINTPLRLAHFLSQCSHESGGFKVVKENLNYSADGLKKIFPKYFPGNLSESYARNPEKIASKVYGGRMGNGDESTKEGYKFSGKGFIQLTGKDNYVAFGKSIGVDLVSHPELVSEKYPLLSAAWFFTRCLPKCDGGSSRAVVESVTKCVNGGLIGIEHRLKEFKHFHELLS